MKSWTCWLRCLRRLRRADTRRRRVEDSRDRRQRTRVLNPLAVQFGQAEARENAGCEEPRREPVPTMRNLVSAVPVPHRTRCAMNRSARRGGVSIRLCDWRVPWPRTTGRPQTTCTRSPRWRDRPGE